MSYDIIYNKQFIKLNNNLYVPIILIGSSNCYDVTHNGKEKRSRDWWTFKGILNKKCYGTLDKMLEEAHKQREKHIERNKKNIEEYGESWGEYSDDEFGYYASLSINNNSTIKTTFSMYKGIFTSGCKNALTVEELLSWGISVTVQNDYVTDDELKKFNLERKSLYPKTTEELKNDIDTLETYYKDSDIGIYVKYNVSEERMKYIQKNIRIINKQNKPKKNIKKEINNYFIFRNEVGNYFVKGTRNGYKYTYDNTSSYVKRMYSEKQANKYCEILNKRYIKKFEVVAVILSTPQLINK